MLWGYELLLMHPLRKYGGQMIVLFGSIGSSVILGLAVLGVASDAMVGLHFCALYHTSP